MTVGKQSVFASRLPMAATLWGRALDAVATASAASRLGLLPPIALAGSAGLLLIALADTLSRLGVPNAPLLFWLGLMIIVLPVAGRLLGGGASRLERIALVVMLGAGLYIVKLLQSPGSFSLFDEFVHWVTLNDILRTDHLFVHNNLLPVSPYYPGLEIVTSALVKAGLPVWEAGVIVVAAGRVLFSLALFLFVERAGFSARVAGVASLIYMANPNYVFFDAQFGYESLALPLAVFILLAVRARDRSRRNGVALTLTIALGIGAVVVTHHITSIALAMFLLAWAVSGPALALIRRRRSAAGKQVAGRERLSEDADDPEPMRETRRGLGVVGPTLMVIIATITWILYIASITVGYLGPALGGALNQVVALVAGDEGSRELFSSSGFQAPVWEQLVAYASVAALLLGIAIGGLVLLRFGVRRAAVASLCLVALVYPASLIGRLTARGAELAARSTEFTFIGVGVVAAVAALYLVGLPRLRGRGRALVLSAIAATFVGGIILGLPFWARLPGPYLVGADPRSVEPIGLAAAEFMGTEVGPGQRILADRTNRNLMATYGAQTALTTVGDRVNLQNIYFTPMLNADDLKDMRTVLTQYVEVDQRLTQSVPYVGVYLERGETDLLGPWLSPMPVQDLAKWDVTDGVDRIYDSGAIQIFNVQPLVLGRQP